MNEPTPANNPNRIDSSRLLVFFLCTFVAAVIVAISAMLMAVGAGLSSTGEDPVSRPSQILWGIGGLAFIPCTVLLVALVATHKRTIGIILSLTVIVAGLVTAIGWFIASGGDMPGTTLGDVLVISVIVIPLTAGGLMLRQSSALNT